MRNSTIIGLTGIAVFVLAWALLSRVPVQPPSRTPETKIAAPLPKTEPKQPPSAAVPVATPPVSTAGVAEQPASIPASPAAAVPAPTAKTPAPDAAESSVDEEDESSTQNAGDEDDSTEENPEAPADDTGRAADLLAEWMARQDTASADNTEVPPSMTALKTFDQESSDPEWSGPSEQQIEATLDRVGRGAAGRRARSYPGHPRRMPRNDVPDSRRGQRSVIAESSARNPRRNGSRPSRPCRSSRGGASSASSISLPR